MNLYFDTRLAEGYKSPAQIARVLTENWMKANGYCPNCGCKPIKKAPNNLPVQDFLCPNCDEQFELKSKSGNKAGNTINDGAYQTMIERIQANDNTSFFFLSYRRTDYSVQQLMLVPKHFMTAEMIKPRKALLETAKRAGWIGCVIDIRNIPESGKILLINRAEIIKPEQVQAQWKANLFFCENRKSQTKAGCWQL